jgi:hypothetical protein
MNRWTVLLTLALCALCLALTTPAQATSQGLDLSKFTLTPMVFVPITPQGETTVALSLQWMPFYKPTAPQAPTGLNADLWPWLQSGFTLIAPLDITGENRGKVAGGAVGETATIGSFFSAPITAAAGYEKTARWSVALSVNLAGFLGF